MEILVGHQEQGHQPRVRLVGMGVGELEAAPLRLGGNVGPARLGPHGEVDGLQGDLRASGHEGLVAALPHHDHHGGQRQLLLLGKGGAAALGLPVATEDDAVEAAGRRPDVDSPVAVEDRVGRFLRSHREQVDLDPRPFFPRGELLHGPIEPGPLLRAVGHADLDRIVRIALGSFHRLGPRRRDRGLGRLLRRRLRGGRRLGQRPLDALRRSPAGDDLRPGHRLGIRRRRVRPDGDRQVEHGRGHCREDDRAGQEFRPRRGHSAGARLGRARQEFPPRREPAASTLLGLAFVSVGDHFVTGIVRRRGRIVGVQDLVAGIVGRRLLRRRRPTGGLCRFSRPHLRRPGNGRPGRENLTTPFGAAGRRRRFLRLGGTAWLGGRHRLGGSGRRRIGLRCAWGFRLDEVLVQRTDAVVVEHQIERVHRLFRGS